MTARALLHEFPAHEDLQKLAAALKSASVEQFFQDDKRFSDFTLEAAGLTLDYSKQLLHREAHAALLELARQAELPQRITALLQGEQVNNTEQRPALHSLLRASRGGKLQDKFSEIEATRARMRDIAQGLNNGQFKSYTGSVITDVVNIGIGGSDLGPRLVTEALAPFHGDIRCHYVANVDPADLQDTLLELDPASTLFIICSKSFRTEETLANSLAARAWMLGGGASEEDLNKHFLAVTTNLEAAAEFGISPANCLPMWDWVGGRYSVWSAVGLSCAIAVGWDHFLDFLAGGEAMDSHFSNSTPAENMPLLMALLEVWNCNYLGAPSHAVLPYDHSLQKLPDFLQQMTMESNGKRVSTTGVELTYNTAPVLWGSAGTLGQHSFHQLLHQGTQTCPVDFVLPLRTHTGMTEQHRKLVSNCLAQSRALMVGRSFEASETSLKGRGFNANETAQLAPHLVMPGNRPNSVITMEALTPHSLGALIALYEHRTYCSGQLWGINPFDQWGVELGKEIGTEVLRLMTEGNEQTAMDPATERLIQAWRSAQG